MKMSKKIGTLVCAAVLTLSIAGCGMQATDIDLTAYRTQADGLVFTNYSGNAVYSTPIRDEYIDLLMGYERVCENRFLTLYVNEDTAAVGVADKRSGKIWFSNTPTIEDDSEIDEDAKKLFYSQLMVEYLDGQNFKQIDSFSASIEKETFQIEKSDTGLSVTYHFLDNKTANPEDTNQELFTITLEYSLDNESLIANIPMSKVAYPGGLPPLRIHVLPHFGGTNSMDEGYLLVPDGSGALIEFNSGKYSVSNYIGNVYGFDKSIEIKNKSANAQQVRMPVFGVCDDGDGFLAIIEDGDALATIQANRAGPYSSFHEVYAFFGTYSYQNISIGNMEKASKLIGIQDIAYQGNLRLRYAFLDTDDSDYVGMASYYREYLVAKDGMTLSNSQNSVPLNLEMIGAIEKLKSKFGIKYEGVEALTTTEQAKAILEELQKNQIHNINLKYSGWFNGGMQQQLADRINIESAVGGKKGFSALKNYTDQNGINLFPSVELLTSPLKSKGFNKFTMAAKQIDQKDAKAYSYDYVTQEGTGYKSILSPGVLGSLSDAFNKAFKRWDISNLCIDDMGQNLYADYTKGNPIDRVTTTNIYRHLMEEKFDNYENLMITGGFSYLMPYADVVLEAPFTGSGYDMIDRAVPFYQMVYHGYTTYSGSPLNLSYDFESDLLKTIEYGGAPYFQLIAADGSVIINTDYSYFCSNNYNIWKNKISEAYHKVSGALSKVEGVAMTGHSQVAEQVYKTVYSNGYAVYVNYGESDVNISGVTVGAKNYTLHKEETE